MGKSGQEKIMKYFKKDFEYLKKNFEQIKAMLENEVREKKSLNSNKCCISLCPRSDLRVFYCGKCKKAHYICASDFKGRSKTKECPVCKTSSILRKWSIPV